MRLLCLLSLLAVLPACTPTVSAQALRFNKGIELGTGKDFAIVAEGNQANNLEFNHYAELVNRGLQSHGLQQAGSLESADYRVTFGYGSDKGTHIVNTYPDYGMYGGFGSYGSHIGLGGTFYPRRSYASSYQQYYSHRFELRITDANARGMPTVFQGRVSAEDGNATINSIMPCLVAALFSNFPGADGVEQTVTLPRASCR